MASSDDDNEIRPSSKKVIFLKIKVVTFTYFSREPFFLHSVAVHLSHEGNVGLTKRSGDFFLQTHLLGFRGGLDIIMRQS